MHAPGVLARMAASPVNYWLGFALDGAGSIALCGLGLAGDAGPAIGALAAGLVTYSLEEYLLHRWLYHRVASPIRAVHAIHHGDPRAVHGAPFFYTLAICALMWGLGRLVVGAAPAAAFAGAVLFAYTAQGVVHRAIHDHRRAGGPVLRRLRRHHLRHHRRGDCNFGVTTTVWDRIFGTAA